MKQKKSPKLIRIINIAVLFIIAIFVFKSELANIYFRIFYSSPVNFQNVIISFPQNIIYSIGEKSIVFSQWENPAAFLIIGRTSSNDVNNRKHYVEFFETKGFEVIDSNELLYQNIPSFEISYVDKSWVYNNTVVIPSKNIYITYKGTRENYEIYFKNIIESIIFKD